MAVDGRQKGDSPTSVLYPLGSCYMLVLAGHRIPNLNCNLYVFCGQINKEKIEVCLPKNNIFWKSRL